MQLSLAVGIGRHFDWAKPAGRGCAVTSDVLNIALQVCVGEPKYTKTKTGEVARGFQHRLRSILGTIIVSAVSMVNDDIESRFWALLTDHKAPVSMCMRMWRGSASLGRRGGPTRDLLPNTSVPFS